VRGELRPGVRVIEYTGGSTGTSLAFVCAVKGYQFLALSSDAWVAKERTQHVGSTDSWPLPLPSEA
jgi:cysteine synthase A